MIVPRNLPACDRLADLLGPPPANAMLATCDSLDVAEKHFGVSLPAEYRWFISVYGSGSIDSVELGACIIIRSYGKVSDIEEEIEMVDYTKNAIKLHRYPLFPTLPGLLPWGLNDQGRSYNWLANRTGSDWPIVTLTLEAEEILEELTFCEFLLATLATTDGSRPTLKFTPGCPN